MLCHEIFGSGQPVDITEVAALVELLPPDGLFERRPKPKANGHAPDGVAADGPVDVEARLAAMAFEGPGDSAIHWTQLHCIGARLRQGVPLDDAVAEVMDATRKCVAGDPEAAGWDWRREEFAVERMGLDLVAKSPELAPCLPEKQWRQYQETLPRLAPGERPTTSINAAGPYFRKSDSPRKEAKAPPVAGDERDAPRAERKFRFKLVSFADLKPGLEPLYLVDELIPVAGLVDVWGKAKCYKSFWCLDLMLHVAMGWEYRDRYVRQGAVIYCAFEGAHGYKKRIEALRRQYAIDEETPVPLYVMPGQANLIAEHGLLIREISDQLGDVRPVAVVLDTLNKSLFGSENKDVDMAAYVRAAEAIRDAFNCVVIIVHHCGHDDTRPRGHSSLPGAVDAQLAVTRAEETITVTVEMMRDGPEDTQVVSAAEVVEVGQDQNGKTLTSLVVVPSDADPSGGSRNTWPRGLAVLHAAVKAALKTHGVSFQPEAGVLPVHAVDQQFIRDRFYVTYAETEEDELRRQEKVRKAFNRSMAEAQGRGVIRMLRTSAGQPMVWLRERGET